MIYNVHLNYTPNIKFVYLRELNGKDELSVCETGSTDAIRLIDRLIVERDGSSLEAGNADEIVTADRDQILAGIYSRNYGSKIESTILCQGCNNPMDLEFDLNNLIAYLQSGDAEYNVRALDQGIFEMDNGSRFRLPGGNDEFAILNLSTDEAQKTLMERCMIRYPKNPEGSPDIQDVMGQVAPIIDTELLTECVECGERQSVHFDIQTYLLSSLINEKNRITIEIHRLASAYSWSHDEILSLPRSIRRMYLSHILAELGLD